MTQATKTLGLLFIISVAAVGLRFAFKGTGTSAALSGTVISFDKAKVTRLDIKNPEQGNFTLQKKMTGWTVQKEGDTFIYPADASAVDAALNQISDLKPKALLTRNEADYSRYQTDSTGTEVRLFDGNSELTGIIVGRFQFVSQQEFNTYVKSVESDDVVSVDGFLGASFNKSLDAWRDKQVLKFDKKGVTQIDFGYPADSSFSIRKVGDNEWMSALDSLDASKVDGTINKLADFKATAFNYSLSPETFGKEMYRVVIHLDNGLKQEVFLNENSEKAGDLNGKANGFDYVFTGSKSSFTSSFLKSRKDFLKK